MSDPGDRTVVRRGTAADIDFVRTLAAEVASHSVPSGRAPRPAAIRVHIAEATALLASHLDGDRIVLLIAERGGQPAGYLVLDLDDLEATTGEIQAAIVDIAVRPEDWGRYVTHHLVGTAAELARQRGRAHLVGTITAANRRALVTARRIGFEVERHQVVLRLDPRGGARGG